MIPHAWVCMIPHAWVLFGVPHAWGPPSFVYICSHLRGERGKDIYPIKKTHEEVEFYLIMGLFYHP